MKNTSFNNFNSENIQKAILEDKYINSLIAEKNKIYTFANPQIIKKGEQIEYHYPKEVLKLVFEIDELIKHRENQIRNANTI